MKWVVLMSGGLDSRLAAELARSAGLATSWLHVDTGCVRPAARRRLTAWAAAPDAPPLCAVDARAAYLRDVLLPDAADPGARRDPCGRCRAFLLRAARDACAREGGCGIVTGDVLGQGGRHQGHAGIARADRDAGVSGRVLRPLSAAWLAPPEALAGGEVEARLRAAGRIQGRGRTGQAALAARLGLAAEAGAPTQGGCCLRADGAYRRRLRDLLDHAPAEGPDVREYALLAFGRHFRLSWRSRAVFARDAEEAARLAGILDGAQAGLALVPAEGRGAPGALLGSPDDADVAAALALAARFGAAAVRVEPAGEPGNGEVLRAPRPASDGEAARWRI